MRSWEQYLKCIGSKDEDSELALNLGQVAAIV